MDYNVKLDIFEGPMDLLVHLIRKNEMDIYDIPIAVITAQYLEYLDLMKDLNINIAGNFLVMAATLIHIKSRMLLPRPPEEEEEDDPRLELTRPLLEYLQLKEAAEQLGQRPLIVPGCLHPGFSGQRNGRQRRRPYPGGTFRVDGRRPEDTSGEERGCLCPFSQPSDPH